MTEIVKRIAQLEENIEAELAMFKKDTGLTVIQIASDPKVGVKVSVVAA